MLTPNPTTNTNHTLKLTLDSSGGRKTNNFNSYDQHTDYGQYSGNHQQLCLFYVIIELPHSCRQYRIASFITPALTQTVTLKITITLAITMEK